MKTVVIAGAVGVIGRGVLAHYETNEDVEIIAISRRPPDFPTRARHLAIDLGERESSERILAQASSATHFVFCAYQEGRTQAEQVSVNLTMLRNAVEGLEKHAPGLTHVTLMQGGKAYAGLAIGTPMNLLMVIAVYGTLSRKLGVPMSFPGPRPAYDALYQVTDARLLASAVDWAGETAQCRGQVYNITNGDYFRWSRVWPRIAEFFSVPVGEPFALSLQETMADKAPIWEELVATHSLRPYAYRDIVSWKFGDAIFKTCYDNITSTIKARRHGFTDCIDTEDMYLELLHELRVSRVIP